LPSRYAPDLAAIHDAGFGGFARHAAPGLLRRLRRAGIRDGLIVDVGCGSGIWARELIDAGYEVLGADPSEAMLRIARRRAPEGQFDQASLLDFTPPRCAAITALGEVVCYAAGLDDLTTGAARALPPGGLLLFDVATPARLETAGRGFFEGEDWLLCNEVSGDGDTLTRRITTFTRDGRAWRRAEEEHTLTLYPADDVLAALDAAGFEPRRIRSYGRELRPPPGLAFFAATRR
jgi:SAM-dependent methyltransferase